MQSDVGVRCVERPGQARVVSVPAKQMPRAVETYRREGCPGDVSALGRWYWSRVSKGPEG